MGLSLWNVLVCYFLLFLGCYYNLAKCRIFVTPFVASQDLVLRMFSNLNKVHIFSAKNHFHLLLVWTKNDVIKDPKSCCSKTWINCFSCIEITWMILKCKNIKLQRIYNSAVSENCCHAGFLQFHWAVDTWSCVGILRALVDLNFEPSGFLLMLLHFNSAVSCRSSCTHQFLWFLFQI